MFIYTISLLSFMHKMVIYSSITCILLLLLFTTGCTNVIKETPNDSENTYDETVISEEKIIIDKMMNSLNIVVETYSGSYQKENKIYGSGRHSGASSYVEKSNTSIKIIDGVITNYSMSFIKEGFPVSQENYKKNYDFSKKQTCKINIVSNSPCTYSKVPISPEMGGVIDGCNLRFDGGKPLCLCDGEEISISVHDVNLTELPCAEPVETEGFELWNEFNIVYFQDRNESLCYFMTLSDYPAYAFECENRNIELIPEIETDDELKNMVCKYSKANYVCSCSFDTVNAVAECKEETPINYDFQEKTAILRYLESASISSISELDSNIFGHCYSFSYKDNTHTFCFNEQNLLTSAIYGINETSSTGRTVNTTEIKMI